MLTSGRKAWSLSTTVRNPERLSGFLRTLCQFEGKPFNEQIQKDYQIALIQARLYRPQIIPEHISDLFNDYDVMLDWQTAETVFEAQHYNDPPMRGRQSLNPLKKLGFVKVIGVDKIIQITASGKRILENPETFQEVFFRAMLKLQFPNPLNRDFSEKIGFNIKPFIGTLKLIKELQEKTGTGITRDEFCLFVPTLLQADRISEHVKLVEAYRDRKLSALDWVIEFYQDKSIDEQNKYFKNTLDYGDNILRAFHLTGFLLVKSDTFGGEYSIQIDPTRTAQVDQLLEAFDAKAERFSSLDEYVEYLGDPDKPTLPWEQQHEIYRVLEALVQVIKQEPRVLGLIDPALLELPAPDTDTQSLMMLEAKLRQALRESTQDVLRAELRHNWQALLEIINRLSDMKKPIKLKPEDFEKFVHDLFVILDDEIYVKPNYPSDTYGNPLTHAPGNRADIEVVYQQFHLLIEVTLDCSRTQWIRETQPVMRHLKEYEDQHPDKKVYCLFLAPRIHTDTYSQFWFAVKYEYAGVRRRIVPLTVQQFRQILEPIADNIRSYDHTLFGSLLDELLAVENVENYEKWSRKIAERIELWSERHEHEN